MTIINESGGAFCYHNPKSGRRFAAAVVRIGGRIGGGLSPKSTFEILLEIIDARVFAV